MSARAERRRAARALAKTATRPGAPRVSGVITDTGQFEQAHAMGSLPPKKLGVHRWILTTAHTVSDAMVRNELAARSDEPFAATYLDHESRFAISIGCWDCEKSLGEITPDSVCETWVAAE